MAKILTAILDPATGEMEIDLAGYKGKGCHAVQEAVTKAMGGQVLEDRRKAEYNQLEPAKTNCVTR
jgi:hypothetical protein